MGPSVKARLRELHAEGTAAARTPSTLSSAASTGSGAIASSMRATAESSPYGAEGFALARALGAAIARLHNCEVIHGDLTTRYLNSTYRPYRNKVTSRACSVNHGSIEISKNIKAYYYSASDLFNVQYLKYVTFVKSVRLIIFSFF
jgi:hypothetical protein